MAVLFIYSQGDLRVTILHAISITCTTEFTRAITEFNDGCYMYKVYMGW